MVSKKKAKEKFVAELRAWLTLCLTTVTLSNGLIEVIEVFVKSVH